MRKFDKLKNIKKVNILVEQRHRTMLNESTEMDLVNFIGQKQAEFGLDSSEVNNGKFTLYYYYKPRIEGMIINGMQVDRIGIDVTGEYKMTSPGYYRPGRCYGPPEDCYPDESENPEFDTVTKEIKIIYGNEENDEDREISFVGSDIKKVPAAFIDKIDNDINEILIESDESDSDSEYDGPDYDDYDPRGEDKEWGGMDI